MTNEKLGNPSIVAATNFGPVLPCFRLPCQSGPLLVGHIDQKCVAMFYFCFNPIPGVYVCTCIPCTHAWHGPDFPSLHVCLRARQEAVSLTEPITPTTTKKKLKINSILTIFLRFCVKREVFLAFRDVRRMLFSFSLTLPLYTQVFVFHAYRVCVKVGLCFSPFN